MVGGFWGEAGEVFGGDLAGVFAELFDETFCVVAADLEGDDGADVAEDAIDSETSDSHLECGDLSPLCLSKTAFLSIGVGKKQTFHFNFRWEGKKGSGLKSMRPDPFCFLRVVKLSHRHRQRRIML